MKPRPIKGETVRATTTPPLYLLAAHFRSAVAIQELASREIAPSPPPLNVLPGQPDQSPMPIACPLIGLPLGVCIYISIHFSWRILNPIVCLRERRPFGKLARTPRDACGYVSAESKSVNMIQLR